MVRQKNLRTARKCAPSKSKCLRCGAFCLIVSSWLSRVEWHLDFVLSAENGRLGFAGKSQLSGVRANQLLTSRKAESPSRWRRVRDWLIDAENRKRFASMGTAGVLSYGVVSNINYIPLFSYAWYLVAVRSKASPIHQWPRIPLDLCNAVHFQQRSAPHQIGGNWLCHSPSWAQLYLDDGKTWDWKEESSSACLCDAQYTCRPSHGFERPCSQLPGWSADLVTTSWCERPICHGNMYVYIQLYTCIMYMFKDV